MVQRIVAKTGNGAATAMINIQANRKAGAPMTTAARAPEAHRSPRQARSLPVWLLLLIGVDPGLIVLRVVTYPAYNATPGAVGYLIPLAVGLFVYVLVIGTLPWLAARMPSGATALRVGTVVGLVGGALELVNISLESVLALPQPVVKVTTLIAMLGLFLTFGVAGFVGGRVAGTFLPGVGAAIWSAVVAILLAITFGLLLANVALPRLARDMAGDPDYQRSGWTDPRAFAIANTFDAAFTHLLEGPIIAFVLGSAGSGLGQIGARRKTALG
jgi:hypothetical protein